MNLQRTLDLCSDVRQDLDGLVRASHSLSLPELVEWCEIRIRGFVALAILAEIERFAKKRGRPFEIHNSAFSFGNPEYELRAGPCPELDPDVLCIMIVCTDRSKNSVIEMPHAARFDSFGQYREIRLHAENIFRGCAEQILEAAQIVIEAGYLWLLEFTSHALREIQPVAVGEEIYGWIRKLLPEQLANNTWPYCIADDVGIYTVDPVAEKTALAHAARRQLNTSLSPLDLVVRFATSQLPREQTFTNIAVSQNKTIQREFARAPYARSGVQIAEQTIYRSPALVIQPIVREGSTQLAIGYPVNLRRDIESKLNHERGQITRTVEAQGSAIRQIAQRLKPQGALPGLPALLRFTTIAGAMSGTFARHFAEHFFEFHPPKPTL